MKFVFLLSKCLSRKVSPPIPSTTPSSSLETKRGNLFPQQTGRLRRAAELSMPTCGSAETKPFSLWVFSCTHQPPESARSCCCWWSSQQSWFLRAENRMVLAAADAFAHSSQLSGLPPKKKTDGQGGTPAIFYRAAKSPLCPQLWELSISWHLVGKAGTVSCVEKKNKQQINWPQRNAGMELNRKIKSADFLPWKSYNLSSNSRERQGRKQNYGEGKWFERDQTWG